MKTGMKALYLALTLMGTSACYSAYATPVLAKSDAIQSVTSSTEKGPAKAATQKAAAPKTADDGVVSINKGSAEELASRMNDIGIKKAQAIVSYREEYGPFKTLEQLQEVPGISGTLVERNRAHIKL